VLTDTSARLLLLPQVAPEALAAWRATVVTTADPQWSLPDRVLAQVSFRRHRLCPTGD
jgi:hypothetical protein